MFGFLFGRDQKLAARNEKLEADWRALSAQLFSLEMENALLLGLVKESRDREEFLGNIVGTLNKDRNGLMMRVVSADAARMQIESIMTKIFNDMQSMVGRNGIDPQWLRDYRKKISRHLGTKI